MQIGELRVLYTIRYQKNAYFVKYKNIKENSNIFITPVQHQMLFRERRNDILFKL